MDNFYSPLAVGSGGHTAPLLVGSGCCLRTGGPQVLGATAVDRGCKPLVVAQNFKVICSLIQQLGVTPHSWD